MQPVQQAQLLQKQRRLNVYKFFPGPLGGAQQIGARIACNEMDLVIFLEIR